MYCAIVRGITSSTALRTRTMWSWRQRGFSEVLKKPQKVLPWGELIEREVRFFTFWTKQFTPRWSR